MTQIISHLAANHICQVSDFLVSVRTSRSGLDPHDRAFSKSILYLAKDALVAVGFTGMAYINDIPTDEWIASILAGQSLRASDGRGFGTQIRSTAGRSFYPTNWLDIGLAVKRLQDNLAMVFADLRRRRETTALKAGLVISIVGWQWKWRWHRGGDATLLRSSPIACTLFYDQDLHGISLERLSRYWGWERGTTQAIAVPKLPSSARARATSCSGLRDGARLTCWA